MKLIKLKTSYDLIVSLGISCAPAINLKRYGLRKFSMPLDWMISYSLSDVNRLLSNKFQHFMRIDNLQKLEETHYLLEDGVPVNPAANTLAKSYFIRDSLYNIISAHDFPILEGMHWSTGYQAFRTKLDTRIMRFWNAMMSSNSILFIRWSAAYEQAAELEAVLSQQLRLRKFNILILNPTHGLLSARELDWGMERVCALEVPYDMNDYNNWDYILKGMSVTL